MFHCSVIKDRFCIAVCLKQLCYYIMSFPACQELFSTFLKLFLFLSCSNFDILSHPTGCCQELFSFLFDSFVISARSLRRNSDRIPPLPGFVNNFFNFSYNLKMSTLNSTFFHVFIVLLFCTICSLFYCIFSLLGSAIVRLPLLPASHAPYFRSYASCFTSSSNSSPAE